MSPLAMDPTTLDAMGSSARSLAHPSVTAARHASAPGVGGVPAAVAASRGATTWGRIVAGGR